eukprot:SAG11_NODE_837_length_6925_cov_43.745532_4_plen_153_part_00
MGSSYSGRKRRIYLVPHSHDALLALVNFAQQGTAVWRICCHTMSSGRQSCRASLWTASTSAARPSPKRALPPIMVGRSMMVPSCCRRRRHRLRVLFMSVWHWISLSAIARLTAPLAPYFQTPIHITFIFLREIALPAGARFFLLSPLEAVTL